MPKASWFFSGSGLQTIAAVWFITKDVISWISGKKSRAMTPFVVRHPIWLLFLLLGCFTTTAIGFWFVFHPPASNVATDLPLSSYESKPAIPFVSRHNQEQAPALKKIKKSPAVAVPAAPINPTVSIGGNVDMSGDGNCRQSVIGGSYNTNNCAPMEAKITNETSTRQVGDDFQCESTFKTDVELTSNIAFTVVYDSTIDREEFAVSTPIIPVFSSELGTTTGSLVPNNALEFSSSMGFPPTIPANGWVRVTVHSKKPIKQIGWKRGYLN